MSFSMLPVLMLGLLAAQAAAGSMGGPEHLVRKKRTARKQQWPASLQSPRKALLSGCGDVCNQSVPGVPGKFFDHVHKSIDCNGLFGNAATEGSGKAWPPPKELPAEFQEDYTMGGAVSVHSRYTYAKQVGKKISTAQSKGSVWTPEMVDGMIAEARAGTLNGGRYGVNATSSIRKLLKRHAAKVSGKHFFVLGSQSPWLEALLLEAGARHITTIEYGKIESKDPRITTMIPPQVRERFVASQGKEPRFDGGASYSSIEHSGLGRYGDILNPWGDLQALAKAWCITELSGPLFFGVPSSATDQILFNSHRYYGPKRWAQLMANWEQEDKMDGPVYDNPDYPWAQQMFLFSRDSNH